MGRTAVHTQEQVFEAADQLAAKGQEVSANALRELLGRGSYSTFVKHIEAWQQQRKAAPAPVIIEMPESVKQAFAQCWQAAATEAGKEIATIREKSSVEIKDSKRRLEEALGVVEELESEAESNAARLEEAERQLQNERQAAQQLATAAAALEAGLNASVTRLAEQVAAQEAELQRVHAQAESNRLSQEAEVQRVRAELQACNAESRSLLKQLGEAQGELAAIKANAEDRKGQ